MSTSPSCFRPRPLPSRTEPPACSSQKRTESVLDGPSSTWPLRTSLGCRAVGCSGWVRSRRINRCASPRLFSPILPLLQLQTTLTVPRLLSLIDQVLVRGRPGADAAAQHAPGPERRRGRRRIGPVVRLCPFHFDCFSPFDPFLFLCPVVPFCLALCVPSEISLSTYPDRVDLMYYRYAHLFDDYHDLARTNAQMLSWLPQWRARGKNGLGCGGNVRRRGGRKVECMQSRVREQRLDPLLTRTRVRPLFDC